MYSFVRWVIILFLVSACAGDISPSMEGPPIIDNEAWEHAACDVKVNPGEKWQSIAELTMVPASILKRYNYIQTVKASRKILIPARKFYLVNNGETALGIAVKYGMTFSEFIALNDLQSPYKLKYNQEVKIIEVIAPISNKIMPKNKKQITKAQKLQKVKFSWPMEGKVVTKFGLKENGSKNDGIIIAGNSQAFVKAAAAGIAVYVGNEISSYGNLVIIQHPGEWISSYGYLSSIDVQKGSKVQAGQLIGKISHDQLYFSLRNKRIAVNPLKYLPAR